MCEAFCLPVLSDAASIGRIDPKAHRKEGIFEVKALHLEPGMVVGDTLAAEVKSGLRTCAGFAHRMVCLANHAGAVSQIVAYDTAGGAVCY